MALGEATQIGRVALVRRVASRPDAVPRAGGHRAARRSLPPARPLGAGHAGERRGGGRGSARRRRRDRARHLAGAVPCRVLVRRRRDTPLRRDRGPAGRGRGLRRRGAAGPAAGPPGRRRENPPAPVRRRGAGEGPGQRRGPRGSRSSPPATSASSARDGRWHARRPGLHQRHLLGGARVERAEIWRPGVALAPGRRRGGARAAGRPRSARAGELFEGMLSPDPAMRQVFDLVERVAASDAAVTILGETGTGKELVARALHARSPARRRPVHPGELLGHRRVAHRVRALRPREGRLLRRRAAAQGRLRGGRPGHPLPRRDRRAAARPAAQAPAGAGARRGEAGRRLPARSRSTSASWPPPTATCAPRCGPASSARTSSTGSAWSR